MHSYEENIKIAVEETHRHSGVGVLWFGAST